MLFLVNASNSNCIATFHLWSNNVSSTVDGSRLLCAVKNALGLNIPALTMVIIGWVGRDCWDERVVCVNEGKWEDDGCCLCKVDMEEGWKCICEGEASEVVL